MGKKMRVDKLLSNVGVASRAELKKYCKQGLISVNGKVINNPKENVNYNYEHLIAKTQSNTSNTLNNLAISCCECNKEKYSNNYKEFQEKKNTEEYLVDRLDKWMLKYNYKEK